MEPAVRLQARWRLLIAGAIALSGTGASGDPLPPQVSASRDLTAAQGLVGPGLDDEEAGSEVDVFTGSMRRTLPLALPPGRGGMVPRIAFAYRSGGGNGWIGVGWGLDLGAVQRSTKNGVNYLADDYVLRREAQEDLVSIGGGEYRAEIEGDFRRVKKLTAPDERPYWEVTDRDGVRRVFGRTAATRQDDPSNPDRIFKWCLERVEDARGNYYTIEYFKSEGAIYPDLISYTGNVGREEEAGPDSVPLAPTSTVRMWRDDGLRPDAYPDYSTGFAVTTRYRLKSIEVRANGEVERVYSLGYGDVSASTRQSLLRTFRTIGSDGAVGAGGLATGTALPAETFSYSSGQPPVGESVRGPSVYAGLSATSAVNIDLSRLLYGDFNGDGRTDVAYVDGVASHSPIKIFLSNGAGFELPRNGPTRSVSATPSAALNDIARLKLGDFNGDGRTDILIIEGGSVALPLAVYLADREGGFPASPSIYGPSVTVNAQDVDVSRVMLGDFDGDGRTDVAYAPPSAIAVPMQIHLSTGTGFMEVLGPSVDTSTGILGLARIKLGDFDGDRRTDVAFVDGYANSMPIRIYTLNAARTRMTFLMYGPPREVHSEDRWAQVDVARVMVADVNGDGKSDFLALEGSGVPVPMSVYLATGTHSWDRFDGPPRTVDLAYPEQSIGRVRLGDFNGDGRTDIAFIEGVLEPEPISMSIHLSEGNRFGGPLAGPARSIWGGSTLGHELKRVAVGDFDGDGRTDFIGNNSNGGFAEMSVYLAQGEFPDLLTETDNGIGGKATIGYVPSSSYANEQLPSPVQTVRVLTVDDGNGVVATSTYAFAGGYYHFGDREFRGFHQADVTGPDGPDGEQAQTHYWFHQGNAIGLDANDPWSPVGYAKGKPYRVQRWDLPKAAYQETLVTYWPASAAPYFAPVREVGRRWCEDPTGQAPVCGRSTRTTYEDFDSYGAPVPSYDAYGNVKRENQYGDEGDPDDDRTIVRSFSANEAEWIVGHPATEKVYAGAGSTTALTLGNQLAGTSYFYDGTLAEPTCDSSGSSHTPTSGNLTKVVRLLKGGTDSEEWTGYDAYGNVVCTSDADRRVTAYAYDATATFRTSITNAKEYLTTTQYYGVDEVPTDTGRYGQPKKVTDPNLAETRFEYDTFGRQTKSSRPPVPEPLVGDPYPGFTVTTSYFLGSVGENRTESLTSAGQWSAEYFDGLGRTYLTKKKGSSSPSARVIAVREAFNPTGTKRETSLPYEDVPGATPRFTRFSYDASGRVTRATKADGTRTLTCYRDLDGSSAIVDANDHRRRQIVDVRGNLIRVQEYRGTHTSCTTEEGTPYSTSQYWYDRMGRLTTVSDAEQNVSVTDYDTLGRRSFQSDPDLGTWYYGYWPSGDLRWQQDANGTSLVNPYKVYHYFDELHRLTLKDYPDGVDEAYVYDDANVPYALGRLTSMTDASGTTTYQYDAIGRPAAKAQLIDQVEYTTGTGYDDAGRINRETYPDATDAAYEYDGDGLLWKVTVDGVTRAQLTGYNALGQVGGLAFGNGVDTAFAYNETGNNRIHSITTSGTAGTLLSLTYGYDNVRNIVTIEDEVDPARSQVFGYDELNRLTSATSLAFADLGYSDAAFGIAMEGAGVTYAYDPIKVHAVKTTTDGRTYDYDANGNLKTDGTRTIEYDYANRPTSIAIGGARVAFTYDASGQRATKQVLSAGVVTSATVYVGRLFECTDGVCTKHVFAGEKRVASVASDGTVRYYHTDHLDSTRVVTDEAGAIAESVFYRPFGDSPGGPSKYRFTSKELDAETGLYFYGARYYNAVLGRFISPDPISPRLEDPQTLNRYAYARNNPVFFVDPSGYQTEEAGMSEVPDDTAENGNDSTNEWPYYLVGFEPRIPQVDYIDPHFDYIGLLPSGGDAATHGLQNDRWPFPFTYGQADNVLDAAGVVGATGELLLRSSVLEGTWGAIVSEGALGKAGFVGLAGQTLVDSLAVNNYKLNGPGPNAISPNKALTNFGFGGASFALGGLPGLGLGASYTLVDSLYPKGSHEGGFEAWSADYTASMNRTWRAQQMLLWPQLASPRDRYLWRTGIRR